MYIEQEIQTRKERTSEISPKNNSFINKDDILGKNCHYKRFLKRKTHHKVTATFNQPQC